MAQLTSVLNRHFGQATPGGYDLTTKLRGHT